MKTSIKNKLIIDYLTIAAGTLIMAVAAGLFYSPADLVTGGFTGLSIVIQRVSQNWGLSVPIWVTNLVLNVPLFLVALKLKGAKMLSKTLFATIMYTVWLLLTEYITPLPLRDLTLTAVFGGALAGLGLGLVFKSMSTTGGTDLLANLIQDYHKHISVSKILFFIDAVIIGLGLFVFGHQKAMYAIIAVFIATKMIDAILEGLSFAKAAFIISEQPTAISTKVMETLHRGVTGINAVGMYTNQAKNMLLCVVSKKELVLVKNVVYDIDPRAFVIVADVREVLGEGFQPIS